jgi:hypothetical protein
MPLQTEVAIDGSESGAPKVRTAEWSVCNQVPHLSNGDKAALRRMYLTKSYRADGVVQALTQRARIDLPPEDDAGFESWRILAHAAAIISGTGGRFPHSEGRSLGRSLQKVGLREDSILRLLTARGPALSDQVRRIVRILARGDSEAIPTNLLTLRQLADESPTVAEDARRLIARDFFAALDAADRKAKGDTK